jgi:hypothetical protein
MIRNVEVIKNDLFLRGGREGGREGKRVYS